MDCNDNVRDKVTPKTSEADVAKYHKEFDTCAVICVDKHIVLLPEMEKRMKDILKDVSQQHS